MRDPKYIKTFDEWGMPDIITTDESIRGQSTEFMRRMREAITASCGVPARFLDVSPGLHPHYQPYYTRR